jgi:hypothetical protein
VTLLQREWFPHSSPPSPHPAAPILDVDDAIWLYRDGLFAQRLAQLCDAIICGNEFLGEKFRRWNFNIHILPTAVN